MARYKCRSDSAVFVTKIAKILSTEKQFINCDRVEREFCTTGPAAVLTKMLWTVIGLTSIVFLALTLLMTRG